MELDKALKITIHRLEAEMKAKRQSAKDACGNLFDFLVERRFSEGLPNEEDDCVKLLEMDLSQATYDIACSRGWLPLIHDRRRVIGHFKGFGGDHAREAGERSNPGRLPTMEKTRNSYWCDRISEWRARYLERSAAAQQTEAAPAVTAIEAPPSSNLFHNEGDFWRLSFEGKTVSLKDNVGLYYICELLRCPGQPIPAVELMAARHNVKSIALRSAGEVVDDTAISQLRSRWRDLRSEISEAERDNDVGRKEKLEAELESISSELRSAIGLGGKRRRSSDDVEKIRKAVSNAISRAITSIRKQHRPLADHLQRSIDRGRQLSYADDRISWSF